MHVLIPQHLPNLTITQRGLIFTHLPRDLRIRTFLSQEVLGGRIPDRDRVICAIKDLEAEAAFLDHEIADLAEVPGVDVGPGVAFTGGRVVEVGGEVTLVYAGG